MHIYTPSATTWGSAWACSASSSDLSAGSATGTFAVVGSPLVVSCARAAGLGLISVYDGITVIRRNREDEARTRGSERRKGRWLVLGRWSPAKRMAWAHLDGWERFSTSEKLARFDGLERSSSSGTACSSKVGVQWQPWTGYGDSWLETTELVDGLLRDCYD